MIVSEPGSFRDRSNKIYYADHKILRGVSGDALESWQAFSKTDVFLNLIRDEKIIATREEDDPTLKSLILAEGWQGVLRHERIPFVSYPYEWPFGMLKDAALLHLNILKASLRDGWILKDASAYNVQWLGAHPTFIDITSFETYRDGMPWVGYRQFCQMFLIPLALKA